MLLVTTKVVAQIEKDSIKPKQGSNFKKQSQYNYDTEASETLLNEYDSTLQNITSVGTMKDGKKIERIDMSKCNKERMAYIWESMNKEQQDVRNKTIGATFIRIITPPTKKAPSDIQIQSWLDSKKYGVWLDGKRIPNDKLSNYKVADFAHYWESKLEKNAINYGKHYFQVDLYTPNYFDEVYVKRNK